jgi:hypothetical protein
MKTLLALCLAPTLWLGVRADDAIPLAYQTLGAEAFAVRSTNPKPIEEVTQDIVQLRRPIPEYPSWIASHGIPGNANLDGADKLRKLAENHVDFTREEIDSILPALDHVDSSIRNDINIVLERIFGIGLVFRGQGWWDLADDARTPYVDAWKKFWTDNRANYGTEQPYVLNDLSMTAELKDHGNLRITIANHGARPIRLWSEMVGKSTGTSFQDEVAQLCQGNGNPFSVITFDRKELKPSWPREIVRVMSQRYMTDDELKKLPDRAVHYGVLSLGAGQEYHEEINLDEAFPKHDLSGQRIIFCYNTIYYKLLPGLWRGDLRSAPLQLPR